MFTLFRAGPQSLGRWWCKMIINVGNKFNLILVVCAASCALFISSFRIQIFPPSSTFSSGKFDLTWSKWILLSDGSNLVLFFSVQRGREAKKKQERRLLNHSRNRLMNRKSWINLITATSTLLCHFVILHTREFVCVCLKFYISPKMPLEKRRIKFCNWSSICFLHFQVRWRESWRHAPTIKVISGFEKTKNWIFLCAKAIKNLIRLLVTNFHTIYRENWNQLAAARSH